MSKSKAPKESQPDQTSLKVFAPRNNYKIAASLLQFLGLIIAGLFTFLAYKYQVDVPIKTTQTANAYTKTEMVMANPGSTTIIQVTKEITIVNQYPGVNDSYLPPDENISDDDTDCISPNIWTPYLGEAYKIDDSGCWSPPDLGIQPINNGFSIRQSAPTTKFIYGIYREISSYSQISLSVNIESMVTVNDLEPRLMLGILPPTLRSKDNGKYLYYQRESDQEPDLFIKLNDGTLDRAQNLSLRYSIMKTDEVQFMVNGTELTIFINGFEVSRVVMPFDAKYFWIGFELPPGTSLNAEVKNITVHSE